MQVLLDIIYLATYMERKVSCDRRQSFHQSFEYRSLAKTVGTSQPKLGRRIYLERYRRKYCFAVIPHLQILYFKHMFGNKQRIRKRERRFFKRHRLLHDVYSIEHLLAAVCHPCRRRSRLISGDVIFHLLYFALLPFITVGILTGILFVLEHKFVVIAPILSYHTVFYIDDYFAHAVEKRRVVRYEYESTFKTV